jgi:hypothetical protein
LDIVLVETCTSSSNNARSVVLGSLGCKKPRQCNAHWVNHQEQVLEQQAASNSSGGSEPVGCRGSCGGPRTPERTSTGAAGGQGAGPRHLKVGDEAAADRVLDVDGTAANPYFPEHPKFCTFKNRVKTI